MKNPTIPVVEDSPDDQELIRMAFEDGHIANEFKVLSDGLQALDYLFCSDPYSPRTALIPVVILTSSDEERDVIASYRGGVNSCTREPVEFNHFAEDLIQLKFYWLILNKASPG